MARPGGGWPVRACRRTDRTRRRGRPRPRRRSRRESLSRNPRPGPAVRVQRAAPPALPGERVGRPSIERWARHRRVTTDRRTLGDERVAPAWLVLVLLVRRTGRSSPVPLERSVEPDHEPLVTNWGSAGRRHPLAPPPRAASTPIARYAEGWRPCTRSTRRAGPSAS